MRKEKLSPQMRLWNSIVACDLRRGPAETLERLERYLRSFPGHGSAWLFCGQVLVDLARYTEAMVALRKATKVLRPNRRHLCFLAMGSLYRQRGRLRLAERWYREAVAANPKTTMGLIHLGAVLALQGRFAEAKRCHRRAARLGVDDFEEAHLNLGLLMRAEGRYQEALRCFERALAVDSRYVEAKRARSDVLRALAVRKMA